MNKKCVSIFFLVFLFILGFSLLTNSKAQASSNFVFNKNLKAGIINSDVLELQKFLNSHKFPIATTGAGSSGSETNKFGLLTQKALIKFQKANNISPAVGYFGPITRKLVNQLLSNNTNDTNSALGIDKPKENVIITTQNPIRSGFVIYNKKRISIPEINGVTIPVKNNTPVTTITESDEYTGTVTWSPNDASFLPETVYTATIKIKPKSKYKLSGIPSNFFTVNGATATNQKNSGVITAVFPATGAEYVLRDVGPAGGFVFYDKGSYSDGWRYMEAAPVSTESSGIAWSTPDVSLAGTSRAIGTGQANTAAIVALLSSEPDDRAAKFCSNLEIVNAGETYSDWFLPSQDELEKVYVNLASGYDENHVFYTPVGNFTETWYWSSTEYVNPEDVDGHGHAAMTYNLGWGWQAGWKPDANRVRAIRAF